MLALIIVYLHEPDVLDEFLASLVKNTGKDFTLFVADFSNNLNIPTDKFPFPIQIVKSSNKGYSHGINVCIKQALKSGFDQFCVLNYDVTTSPNFIENVSKGFLSADFFGGKIYYAKGFEFHKKNYSKTELGRVIWYAGGLFDWANMYATHRGVDEVDSGQYDRFEETEFITGCMVCFNKDVLEKVGPWNEHFFLYYEDADFSIRARKKGFRLYYNPDVVIYHKNAGITGGSGSLFHQKTQKWSQLYFGLLYAPFRTKLHLVVNYLLSYVHGKKK
ncbi:MAG: glycosyltransferase family 2 protein [Patescibacteria group bacterium]|jgi:hypothetical protein